MEGLCSKGRREAFFRLFGSNGGVWHPLGAGRSARPTGLPQRIALPGGAVAVGLGHVGEAALESDDEDGGVGEAALPSRASARLLARSRPAPQRPV